MGKSLTVAEWGVARERVLTPTSLKLGLYRRRTSEMLAGPRYKPFGGGQDPLSEPAAGVPQVGAGLQRP
jgi:hypothetical protein